MSSTVVDIHILQSVPPSNLNRDDTGSPKSAVYGGVRRARVSSQAWKRATRKAFDGLLDEKDLGVRTKQIVSMIANQVASKAPELEGAAEGYAVEVVTALGLKVDTPRKAKKGKDDNDQVANLTEYLVFLGNRQIERLADLAIESARSGSAPSKKDAVAAAQTGHGVDVALFGRMVADSTELRVDAAAQVAHAISVHRVDNEFDYFTAVDDGPSLDHAGAGMIGTIEFNSSTLYRFATVNVDGLRNNLGDTTATARAVEAFVKAFVTSMPTGKQNTFANRTLPDAVVVMVREAQSVNLVGAFEEAVDSADGHGRLRKASTALAEYSRGVDSAYGSAPVSSFVVRVGESTSPLSVLGQESTLEEAVHGVGELVLRRLGVEE